MTTGSADKLFFGRQQLVERLTRAVTGGKSMGAIVVGEAGSGRTALASRVGRQIGDSMHIVDVHGSSVAARMPFGALRPLLDELPGESIACPQTVLQHLTEQLRRAAQGNPVLLRVDNADVLDELGATAINQLVLNGTCRVLLICEDLPSVPGNLMCLWTDGLVSRIDVGAVTVDDTMDLASGWLGARVSRSAAEVLWDASGGNVLFLEMLTREQVGAGTLVQHDGIWVLSGPGARYRGEIVNLVTARLARLTGTQREVLELLSLTGGLNLTDLLNLADGTDIDVLEERGAVSIDRRHAPVVRVRSRLIADVVKAAVPFGRSSRLHQRVADVVDVAALDSQRLLAYATWTLDCGGVLPVDVVLPAARAANSLGESGTVLTLLDQVGAAVAGPAGALARARAQMRLGRFDDAGATLARLDADGDASSLSLSQWVQLKLLRSSLIRREAQAWPQARGLVEEVRNRLETADAPARLHDELLLAEVDLAIFTGRYAEIEPVLVRHLESAGHGPEVRLHLSGQLAHAWAMLGRHNDAMNMVDTVREQLRAESVHPQSSAYVGMSVFMACSVSGSWERCRELLVSRRRLGWTGRPETGTAGELADGVLLAFAGRPEQALEQLVPALSQLHMGDDNGAMSLALAAAAYASSLGGDPGPVRRYLDEYGRHTQTSSWLMRESAFYFATLAGAAVEPGKQVTRRLLDRADDHARSGTVAQELLLVSAAARLGSGEAAKRLISTAAVVQGPFARLCETFAKGVTNRDSSELIAATRMAAAAGYDLFALDAAQMALETARSAANRSLTRRAQQLIHRAHRKIWGASQGAAQSLTEREREIAALAATGATNRAIAGELCLSVRTVEGHLQQIYRKLQVSSRADLPAI